jgi:hypothetical protein
MEQVARMSFCRKTRAHSLPENGIFIRGQRQNNLQKWRREHFSQFNVDELLEEVRKHHARKVS